eukprot:12294906-Ditylum_brightwellii.AAC.1
MLAISSKDIIAHAAEQLSHALQHPHPTTLYHQFGSKQIQALQQLAQIFRTMTNTNHNIPYQEYAPPPLQVPEHIKVTETTPPPRVEKEQPHIIQDIHN